VSGNVVIDGGSQAACVGTFTGKGGGQWNYAPTQAETNGTELSFQFNAAGAVSVGLTFYTDPANFDILDINASGQVSISSSIKQGTAVPGFMFVMTDSTTHAPKPGLGTGVSFLLYQNGSSVASSSTVTEVANGIYTINLSSSDTNASKLMLNFQATGADALNIELVTQP